MMHHATVFEGDPRSTHDMVHRYVRETLEVVLEANPDVCTYVVEQLTVDDSRELKHRASQAPLGSKQVFMVTFDRATREAQNALLKVLEEPGKDTYFVLMVPTVEMLLPTVRSRLAYGGRNVATADEHMEYARQFLHVSIGERLRMLEPVLEKKDRAYARSVVDAIESVLRSAGVRGNADALREVAFVRGYITDTSSSLKMLLEHLAVSV